jgi:hypothetical protein
VEAELAREAMSAVRALERAFAERFAPNGLSVEGSELWWTTPFVPTRSEVNECICAFVEPGIVAHLRAARRDEGTEW